MKIRNLLFIGLAAAALFTGCKEEETTTPSVTIDPATLTIPKEGKTETVTISSNRDWVAEVPTAAQNWVKVTPSSGSATESEVITIEVSANDAFERTAKVVFNASLTSATLEITQEGTPLEITTIADFKTKPVSNDTWYYLKGTISAISSTEYGNLTLQDNTGSIDVRGVTATQQTEGNDKSFESLGLKVGDILTICGIRGDFNGTAQAGTNQIPTYYITHTTMEDLEAVALESIEDVFTTTETKVTVKGNVVAVSKQSFVLNDGGEKNLLVYSGAEPAVKTGDNVSVTGVKADYNGLTQLTSPEVETISETITPAIQDARKLTGNEIKEFSSESATLISVDGIFVVDGEYQNIYFEGTDQVGSVVSSSFDEQLEDGDAVTITGYYGSRNNGGYMSIIPVEVKECTSAILIVDAESAHSVGAAAGEYKFDVLSNADWTVTSTDAANFAATKTGSTVTVAYTANEGEERSATVTVSTTDNSKKFGIVITQAAAPSGDALIITLDAATKPCDNFPEGSTGETTTQTYTIDDYEWTFSPSSGDKFSWYSDQKYILWGKKDAYILLPAVADKHLTSVTILTGKNASTSVKVGVYAEDGSAAVGGGTEFVLNAKNTEFSWTLTGTENNTHYQLRVCSAHNAQLQKLTLVYE